MKSIFFFVPACILFAAVFFLPDHIPLRRTTATTALEKLSPAQRTRLAQNPDQLSLQNLNESLSALNAIEFNQTHDASPDVKELRVVAWNIEQGRYWREAAKLLQAQHADVILLSEVDMGMARSGNTHVARELAAELGMNYIYSVEFLELWEGGNRMEGTNAQQDYGYHGNAILSRFQLQNTRMIRFPGIERWWGTSQHRLGGRMALFAEIATLKGTVTVVSTHLESAFGDTPMRLEEVQMIDDELQTHAKGMPVILGGDMNAVPKSEPMDLLRKLGFDLDSANVLDEGTSQGFKNDGSVGRFMHIDYIAVRGLQAHDPVILDAYFQNTEGKNVLISDHAAVVAVVALP